MASVLDYYGYSDSEVGLVSTTTQQTAKDNEQDKNIKKNYDDNVIQQEEIDRNTSINRLQEEQINDIYNIIGQGPSSGTTILYTIDTNFDVVQNGDFSFYNVSYETRYNGEPVIPNKCTITKYVNDGNGIVLLDNTGVSGTTITSTITGNKEKYVLEAVPDSRIAFTTKSELTKYICYIGSSSATTMTSEVIETFHKYVTNGSKFNANENTASSQYLWLIIPSCLDIQSITSDSVAFALNDEIQTITNSLGTFNCYRSNKLLVSSNWRLMIFTSET